MAGGIGRGKCAALAPACPENSASYRAERHQPFSGACYHVFNRGNDRRALFTTDGAAGSCYGCLDAACTSYG